MVDGKLQVSAMISREDNIDGSDDSMASGNQEFPNQKAKSIHEPLIL
jgi:hypothetical protein